MKIKEFKTSKGEFVIVDSIGRENYYEVIRYYIENNIQIEYINLLKYITEDQAKEIVDEPEYLPCNNCLNGCPVCGGYGYSISFIKELNSLIKSLGIHLYENPYKDWLNTDDYDIAESLTFYNPYIFKKI